MLDIQSGQWFIIIIFSELVDLADFRYCVVCAT